MTKSRKTWMQPEVTSRRSLQDVTRSDYSTSMSVSDGEMGGGNDMYSGQSAEVDNGASGD